MAKARKLYPYVRAEQKKAGLAPMMRKFIDKNRDELKKQGNTVLKGPGEMKQSQAKKPLASPWNAVIKKGTSAGKVNGLVKNRGGTRASAKKHLVAAHTISFGADPDNK